jgi:hypothetical protein
MLSKLNIERSHLKLGLLFLVGTIHVGICTYIFYHQHNELPDVMHWLLYIIYGLWALACFLLVFKFRTYIRHRIIKTHLKGTSFYTNKYGVVDIDDRGILHNGYNQQIKNPNWDLLWAVYLQQNS